MVHNVALATSQRLRTGCLPQMGVNGDRPLRGADEKRPTVGRDENGVLTYDNGTHVASGGNVSFEISCGGLYREGGWESTAKFANLHRPLVGRWVGDGKGISPRFVVYIILVIGHCNHGAGSS